MLRQSSVLKWFVTGILLGVVFMPTTANGAVAYREIFPNDTGASLDISSTGWQSYWGAVPTESDTTNTLLIGGIAGKPTDATPINSNPASPELVNGWFYVNQYPALDLRNLVFTTEAGLVDQAVSTAQLGEVSWYAANAQTTAEMRVAIQVGSNWYGSEQTFNNSVGTVSGATFPTDAELFTFNAATANWFPITFTPETELSINTSSVGALPGGTVAGIGLYFQDSTGSDGGLGLRIDTFAVSTVGSPVVPGDFDSDGDVDGADFVVWQTNFPTAMDATLADGDADGDGDVDGADFVVWQTNFPTTPGAATSVVPEPGSILLALIGLSLLTVYKNRPRGNGW